MEGDGRECCCRLLRQDEAGAWGRGRGEGRRSGDDAAAAVMEGCSGW